MPVHPSLPVLGFRYTGTFFLKSAHRKFSHRDCHRRDAIESTKKHPQKLGVYWVLVENILPTLRFMYVQYLNEH